MDKSEMHLVGQREAFWSERQKKLIWKSIKHHMFMILGESSI